MTDNDGTDAIDHLFTEAVQAGPDGDGYGSWRSLDAPGAVSLSFGFPFPTSFPATDLVSSTAAVLEAEGERALQYGGGDYADRLAEVVLDRERSLGIDCEESDVLLTNGATHAIDAVCRAFLERGDEVFVAAPTFMGALHLFENYGVELTGFEVTADGLDVDAVAAELERRHGDGRPFPKLLYVIPTFQNPTGTTMSCDRRERLLDLAETFDFVVLEDDAYGDLRYHGDDVPPLKALDGSGRVVRVGTFSKTVAPGVRTGWVLADGPIRRAVDRLCAGGTNTFTQSVLGHYCTEGTFEEDVDELRVAYARRCDHMLACLDESMPHVVEWTEPNGGFFVWVELPRGFDTDELLPVAAEEGVTYLPGDLFFPGERGDRYLRLSFSQASAAEIERGVAALARSIRAELTGE